MKFWFGLFVLLLIVSNIWAFAELDHLMARYVQLFSTGSFLLFALFKYPGDRKMLLVLSLLTLCDGLIIFYEDPLAKKLIYSVRIALYIAIVAYLYPYLSKLRLNVVTVIISLFVIAIDVYLLHDMAVYIPNYLIDIPLTVLFYSLGLTSLVLVATCISYLNRYSNTKGFLIFLVSLCFVMSDITFYNAYYLDFEVFYYVDKVANIIGIAAFILFMDQWLPHSEKGLMKET